MRGPGCSIYITLSLLLCIAHTVVWSQIMQGQIIDIADNKPIEDVLVTNIFTEKGDVSDKLGKFAVPAAAGELVEFRREGYKVIRVRIPQGKMAPYCKVGMQKYNPSVPMFENMASPDYKSDSLKYAMLYKKELDFPQLSGVQAIEHPFSALSKRNRQIWAFQKEYIWFQQQKFIDYLFSDQLISSLTGLGGDSLKVYKQLFRPTYDQIKAMGEYNFLAYIKRTVTAYRKRGIRARMSPSRNTR